MPFRFGEDTGTTLEIKRPSLYAVVMHNDDYTTMDVVVDILIRIFGKNENDAMRIMMEVHIKGESIVGVYTYDIAITKKTQAVDIAAQKGFPLKVTVSEAKDQ